MKIVVDFDKCDSNAICMNVAPKFFEVKDDNFLYILEEHPADDMRSLIEDAVRQCPTGAISIEDD